MAYKLSEGKFKGYSRNGESDLYLFFQVWECENPVGNLVITHGQAEHSDAYHRLIKGLEGSGWNIYAWDLRGHGRSDGKRGFAKDFSDYCKDYELFVNKILISTKDSNKPLVTLGHSMGGLIQTKALIENPHWPIHAQVLSAPLLGLSVAVPWVKDQAAKLLYKVYPELTLSNELKFEDLSRDEQVIEAYYKDPLRHDRISSGVYLGFVEAMPYVQARANKIKTKSLMQIPTGDKITSPTASKEFYNNLGATTKKLIEYEGAYHEIYNDTIREQAYKDLIEFLKGSL